MWAEFQLWRKWRKVGKEADKMQKQGYDHKKSLKAGAWGFGQAAAGVMLTALIGFASQPEAVNAALESMDSPGLQVAVAGLIVAAARYFRNRSKHK